MTTRVRKLFRAKHVLMGAGRVLDLGAVFTRLQDAPKRAGSDWEALCIDGRRVRTDFKISYDKVIGSFNNAMSEQQLVVYKRSLAEALKSAENAKGLTQSRDGTRDSVASSNG